jgi:superfamily II DNA helicase RecQ
MSPNRQNIKLRFSKVSNKVEIAMTLLLDALNDLKQNFPMTIIYCNSITDASKIYTYITSRMFRRREYSDYHRIERHKQ